MSRFIEFFEDSSGRLSQHRLITFIVFLIGAVIILVLAVMKLLTLGMFSVWIGSGSATYGTGKVSDLFDKSAPSEDKE